MLSPSLIDEKYWANCNATVWELYSPENDQPGTRWDTYNLCRPNYIPTSGFGPVAMLIEDVLGFNVNGPDDQLTWRLWLLNKHGIRNLKFGNNLIQQIDQTKSFEEASYNAGKQTTKEIPTKAINT